MRPLTVRQMSMRQLSRHQIFTEPVKQDYLDFSVKHWDSYNGSTALWAESVAHAFLLHYPNTSGGFQGIKSQFQELIEERIASIAFDRFCRKEYNRWASPFVDEVLDENYELTRKQRDQEEMKEEAAYRIAHHIAKRLTARDGQSVLNESVMEKNRQDVLFWMNRVGFM
jgi:hypothetical protein